MLILYRNNKAGNIIITRISIGRNKNIISKKKLLFSKLIISWLLKGEAWVRNITKKPI